MQQMHDTVVCAVLYAALAVPSLQCGQRSEVMWTSGHILLGLRNGARLVFDYSFTARCMGCTL
jgi:hypothetical protein